MREYKIVVLGQMGAGKSTLVQALAQGRAVSTEVRNTDPAADKPFTTVAMDYGDIDLPGGDRLRLYGTPGQIRFDFLWPILLEGASGAIVLVNADAGTPQQQVQPYLDAVERHPGLLPVVMGVTRMDDAAPAQRAACEQWLEHDDGALPIVMVDPRDPMQVLTVMDVLMSQIECQTLVACDE
jgi:signal recognition particle receptor subunit beta